MVRETVADTWFVNIWKSSRKSISREPERPVVGIMAFETSRLMSKVVNLWQCLADRQIVRLREEIANSVGIHKLVSEDDDYLMDLALTEITENLRNVANSVVMLGKKCKDPKHHNLERTFDDVGEIDPKWCNWRYSPKKMEKKVKKMEKFVGATEQLHQELEVLAELEQSLRRMRASSDVKLLEFQQKVMWQRQEVKNLREMSPWVRTYDYIVRLLLRSIFTIIERKKYVCGTKQSGNFVDSSVYEQSNSDCIIRSSSLRQTLVYPSETNTFRYAVPLGRSFSSLTKSKNTKSHYRSQSSIFSGKQNPVKDTRLFPILCNSKSPPKMSFFEDSSLGGAGLAVHYANVIILIEKLALLPNLISLDARDDLYSMLPATIRSDLRAKLKTFSRNLALSVYDDAAFAAEWRLAVERILEWLSPLAHNMVRWQSERNFERWRLSFGSNVHLVQTLHFANQVETEAAIVELLVGLNYLSRFGREINQKPCRGSSCSRAYYMFPRDNMYYKMIDHAL
ncbi:hypothetical protein DH2020_014971 [Rehmannia glutinosa]|uniref:DUF668 domain-containing protein n=1 Tax=Rehmannia glutinosa TaxID=99300 RepID=A0ABR0WZG7_REHGL